MSTSIYAFSFIALLQAVKTEVQSAILSGEHHCTEKEMRQGQIALDCKHRAKHLRVTQQISNDQRHRIIKNEDIEWQKKCVQRDLLTTKYQI